MSDPAAHWYRLSGATISGNQITLALNDGGPGDGDRAVNGEIEDPGGPGLESDPMAIPTLSVWALPVLVGLLAAAGTRLGQRRSPGSSAG